MRDLILKPYQYFYDIIKAIVNGWKLPVHEMILTGGRYSGKTTAIEKFIILLTQYPNLKIGISIVRYGEDGFLELFNEFCETCENLNINYSASKQNRSIIICGYKIRFNYAKMKSKSKAQKAGMSRFVGVDYIITWFEEAFEFDSSFVSAYNEAVRGDSKDVQTLTIYSCNPWAKSSWIIQKAAQFQNWDLSVLKTTGSQIGIYERTFQENLVDYRGEKYTYTLNKKTLVHYTNWRITKHVLGDEQIKNVLDTWNVDRNRAMVSDYGLPGYENGAIYTHELHKIGKCIVQEHEWLFGGGDYGWSQQEAGGKTVFVFGGASLMNGVDVYAEYKHDNALHPKPVNILVKEIVDFYAINMETYCRKMRYSNYQVLEVRVDNMAREFIYLLQQEANKRSFNVWLRFVPSRKFPISDRIVFVLNLLSRHFLRLDGNCLQLKSDFEMSAYEETETQKRMKKYDHALNAFEYGCEKFMYQFATKMDQKLLKKKFL